jgi:hypothetical protein
MWFECKLYINWVFKSKQDVTLGHLGVYISFSDLDPKKRKKTVIPLGTITAL